MAQKRVEASAEAARPENQAIEDGLVLVDKSAWEQRSYSLNAKERIDRLAAEGRAATCLPVALEQLYSARNQKDFTSRREALDLLVWLPITPAVENQAIETMAKLAAKGQLRVPLPDVMIAATALVHGATILHYDQDFERIAATTGQVQEWIFPRGTGHGNKTVD